MHIPDGFLSLPVLAGTNFIGWGGFILSIKKLNKEIKAEIIPLMGMATAFLFTINMISFPLVGGTSAHLTGVTLISIIFGPYSGYAISTAALLLQGLLFQHGGILTMGANILNIALCGSIGGAFVNFIKGGWGTSGIISFFAVITGVFLCSVELYLSRGGSLYRVLSAMIIANIFPAMLDGIISSMIIKYISKKQVNFLNIRKI